MHEFVSIDGVIALPAEAKLDALSRAALYGAGVFTTIRIYDREPFLLPKHWRRLESNAIALGIDLSSITESVVKRALKKLVEKNNVENGRARVTLFDTSSTDLWRYDCPGETAMLISTADSRTAPEKLRLTVSPYQINSTSPLKDIKSTNYLERLIAREDATQRGFDDCVQLNERGEVASASMANLFWLKDGKLFTPSLETGCLAGTTREFVIENHECEKVRVGLDELRNADAIFLTSAGYGIALVAEFDGQKLRSIPHAITSLVNFAA